MFFTSLDVGTSVDEFGTSVDAYCILENLFIPVKKNSNFVKIDCMFLNCYGFYCIETRMLCYI